MSKLKTLVDNLYWEYDRMSSCGKEALDKLAVMVNVPTQEEFEKDFGCQSKEL